jgi:2-succinyl-5-enolpyruvyl-6-hydroxy-3-cyclohexene-1-carboxylate synthase
VAGDLPPGQGRRWAEAVERAGLPLLAEPSSNARRGGTAIRFYRDLLPQFEAEIEQVIVLGHPTLSRPVMALLARPDRAITVVTETADWPDPGWAASAVVAGLTLPAGDPAWLARWQAADRRRAEAAPPDPMHRAEAAAGLPGFDSAGCGRGPITVGQRGATFGPGHRADATVRLTGPALAAAVLAALGPEDNLVLGASNPLRDADLAPIQPDPPAVYANRGLAGIDGTIATAFGLAAASGRPTTALIGDLTALHDLGSLIRPALERRLDLRLVVADDDGGSIFAGLEYGTFQPPGPPGRPDSGDRAGGQAAPTGSQRPEEDRRQAGPVSALARCFTVPTGLDFVAIAQALGASATRLTTAAAVVAALAEPWSGCRCLVVPIQRRGPRRAV